MTGEIIRAIVMLMLLTGAVLLISDKTRYGGKAVISDAVGITAFFALIEVFVSNIGIGTPGWILLTEFAVVIIVAALIICAVWGYLRKKSVWIPLVSVLVMCGAAVGAYHTCMSY